MINTKKINTMEVSIVCIKTGETIAKAKYKYEKSAQKWFDTVSWIMNLNKKNYIFKTLYN